MRRALYPGTFDPITNGHIDVIERASRIFDSLVVAVARGAHKNATFSLPMRQRLVKESTNHMKRVEVVTLTGLLAEKCKELSIDVVIRGLRAVSDFEYEMMMALMNRKLYANFETVFLMPSARYVYLHSSLVREVYALGGDVSDLVPEPVSRAFKKKRRRKKR